MTQLVNRHLSSPFDVEVVWADATQIHPIGGVQGMIVWQEALDMLEGLQLPVVHDTVKENDV